MRKGVYLGLMGVLAFGGQSHAVGWQGVIGKLTAAVPTNDTRYSVPNTDPEYPSFEGKAHFIDCSSARVEMWPYDWDTGKRDTTHLYVGKAYGRWCDADAPDPNEWIWGVWVDGTSKLIPYGVTSEGVAPYHDPVTPGGTPPGVNIGTCHKGDGIMTYGYCPSQQCEMKADPLFRTGSYGSVSCPYTNLLGGFCWYGIGSQPKSCWCAFEEGTYANSDHIVHLCNNGVPGAGGYPTAGAAFPNPSGIPETQKPQ